MNFKLRPEYDWQSCWASAISECYASWNETICASQLFLPSYWKLERMKRKITKSLNIWVQSTAQWETKTDLSATQGRAQCVPCPLPCPLEFACLRIQHMEKYGYLFNCWDFLVMPHIYMVRLHLGPIFTPMCSRHGLPEYQLDGMTYPSRRWKTKKREATIDLALLQTEPALNNLDDLFSHWPELRREQRR